MAVFSLQTTDKEEALCGWRGGEGGGDRGKGQGRSCRAWREDLGFYPGRWEPWRAVDTGTGQDSDAHMRPLMAAVGEDRLGGTGAERHCDGVDPGAGEKGTYS